MRFSSTIDHVIIRNQSECILSPEIITRLFEYFFLDFWVVWILFKDVVADVDGVDAPLGLHVVERELVADRGVCLFGKRSTRDETVQPSVGHRKRVMY